MPEASSLLPPRAPRTLVLILLAAVASLFTGVVEARDRAQVSAGNASTFRADKLQEIDRLMRDFIQKGNLPGAVLWMERGGQWREQAWGMRMTDPRKEPASIDTIYDAASLTKAVVTAPCVLMLAEDGKLKLDDPVSKHIPEFTGGGKEAVTIGQLLTHSSGMPAGLPRELVWSGYAEGVRMAAREPLRAAPGEKFIYSDLNFILLGEIVRRVSGEPLPDFAKRRLFKPLKMEDSGFNPPAKKLARVAPTTREAGGLVRGVVHDPTARRMGGVAGHAGLFTTAKDVALWCRMLLNGGKADDGRQVMKPETVKLLTTPQPGAPGVRRSYGLDIISGYSDPRGKHFSTDSCGHTGWTGPCFWVDPGANCFYVFMTNRNHPTEEGTVRGLRGALSTLTAEAMGVGSGASGPKGEKGASAAPAKTAEVKQGVDALAADGFKALAGKAVGLITNHTGADKTGRSTIDLLHQAPGVDLRLLFSPEHGLRGELDHENIPSGKDERTGLPYVSLYGKQRRPLPRDLEGLDALVFDIQDIGCRFYTYISTMLESMKAADEAGMEFIVLDRVNPVNGVAVEGPVLAAETSFVACHPIPVRHGMTIGELARLFAADLKLERLKLTVVPVQGWKRDQDWPATGLPWINPSPNMRSPDAAVLYPGIGLLEFTNLSVGRGTDTPFQLVGAPWIDAEPLAEAMNAARLPGVKFEAATFTPVASVFKGEPCQGIRITVTDRAAVPSVRVGLTLAEALWKRHGEVYKIDAAAKLLGHPATLEALKKGEPLKNIEASWEADLKDFRTRRAAALLYPEAG